MANLKPLHARWIVEMNLWISKTVKKVDLNGFDKTGITEAAKWESEVFVRIEIPLTEKGAL